MIKKYLKRWQTKKSIYTVNLSNRLIKNKNTEEFDKIMKTYNILKFHLVYLKEKDEKTTRKYIYIFSIFFMKQKDWAILYLNY